MQKALRFLLTAAAMAGLVSCASDEPVVPANGDAEHFSISIPSEVISRGFADGSSAKNIYVAVYPADDNSAAPYISSFNSHPVNKKLVGGNSTVSDRTADISITLVKGKAYNVLFWVETYEDNADGCPYTFKPADRTISVDYSKMVCNSDAPDAFYYYGNITASGANHEIQLHRPLAQINIGTDDYQAASMSGLTVTTSAVTFSNLADTFKFTDGSATGDQKNVTLASAIPTADESFPVGEDNKYRYLNMTYVLVNSPAEGNGLIDNVTLSVNGKEAYSPYSNIPVRRNYRTNIYGSLLTNEHSFTVTMTEYNNDDINQEQPEFVEVNSLPEFKSAVERGENVILTHDLQFSGDYTFAKPVIIDLGGYTLTGNFTNDKDNSLTIQGKGNMKTRSSILITNNGVLKIKGGNFEGVPSNNIIVNRSGGTCVIDDGIFNNALKKGVCPIKNEGNMIINNGVFKSSSIAAVNNQNKGTTITINDGIFVSFISLSNEIKALNVGSNTSAIINGGKFSGYYAVSIGSGGIVNIRGGYFDSLKEKATIYTLSTGAANITGGYFTNLNMKNDTKDPQWKLPDGYDCVELKEAYEESIGGSNFFCKYQVVSKTSTGK